MNIEHHTYEHHHLVIHDDLAVARTLDRLAGTLLHYFHGQVPAILNNEAEITYLHHFM